VGNKARIIIHCAFTPVPKQYVARKEKMIMVNTNMKLATRVFPALFNPNAIKKAGMPETEINK
jgi:hypothetical protein